QRQIFPPIDSSMLVSVGGGVLLSKATALMICPLWQYPHWTTSSDTQAAWTARPTKSWPTPSMVRMGRLSIRDTGTTHDRVATPARCTVQAPQEAIPQPYLVPVF